jgi:hypothetical protein
MTSPGIRRSLVTSLVLVLVAVASGCVAPVRPAVEWEHSTFEGFPVISYVPEDPRGLVFLFHGTNGSADIAQKVESVDVLNTFIGEGYGFVSTSSTERTGDKRWDVSSDSLSANPDLARLARLWHDLVASTAIDDTTPLFGIGHSNGSRFVTLWGESFHDAGYPVGAIWASAGRIAAPVDRQGGLTVPTFFTTAVNDFTSPPGPIIADYDATRAAGTPAELRISQERALTVGPFLRVPGVDLARAEEVVAALKGTGVWDARGVRVVPDIQQAAAQAQSVSLPGWAAAEGLGNDIANQTAIVLAVHQFTAEFEADALRFFEAARP